MPALSPFKINVPDRTIAELHDRLARTRLPTELADAGWRAGPPLAFITKALERLEKGFDWRAQEATINRYPQFMTEIDGQSIHFLHVRSARPGAVALLLIHGWPGSIVEFLDVIEDLTAPVNPDAAAFHLIIPSLPGFGFSGPTHEAGWNNGRIARALIELMSRLGYARFGVQGGDAGAIIGPEIGRLAPECVIGVHVNAATLGFIPMGPVSEAESASYSNPELARLQRLRRFMAEHFAFNMVQATRPHALAYALSDSPAGLLAWMSELFTSFGDRPGAVDLDRFLTNVLIYWFTGTAASSTYLYYENAHDPSAWAPKANSGVPTAVAVFGYDEVPIRRYSEQGNTIARWTEFDVGGHYAALEVPDIWAGDVRAFFESLR